MKIKSFISVLLTVVILFSCCACKANQTATYTTEENTTRIAETELNIGVLKNNAASFGLLELMQNAVNNENNYKFTHADNVDDIYKLLDSGEVEVATLPIISAIRYSNMGKTKIKLLYAASNFTAKILSKDNEINSMRDLTDKTIYTAGKYTMETASLFLLSNRYTVTGLNSFTPTLKYADDADHLLKIIDTGKLNYCMVTEPLATIITNKHPEFKEVIDLNSEFKSAVNNSMLQDCIVITEDFLADNPQAVDTFITRCKTSVVFSNYSTATAANLAETYQLAESSDLAMNILQNSNITFLPASNVADANQYLMHNDSKLMSREELFDGLPPESNFYYVITSAFTFS